MVQVEPGRLLLDGFLLLRRLRRHLLGAHLFGGALGRLRTRAPSKENIQRQKEKREQEKARISQTLFLNDFRELGEQTQVLL